jgi:PilZ domain
MTSAIRGAFLNGLTGLVEPGKKVEIDFRDQTASYRVQWIGKNGSPKAGRTGVRCLRRSTSGMFPPGPGRLTPTTMPGHRLSRSCRERFPPIAWSAACSPVVNVASKPQYGQVASLPCGYPEPATDISLGGCYMEMMAPLPIDTDLEIVLTPEDTSLRVRGTVRSSHAGLGMGIAFTSMSPASFETPPICSTGRTLCQ